MSINENKAEAPCNRYGNTVPPPLNRCLDFLIKCSENLHDNYALAILRYYNEFIQNSHQRISIFLENIARSA